MYVGLKQKLGQHQERHEAVWADGGDRAGKKKTDDHDKGPPLHQSLQR